MDTDISIEVAGFAALALGLVFAGSCHADSSEAILQSLMMRTEAELSEPYAKFLPVALGLLYLGKQDACDATLEVNLH